MAVVQLQRYGYETIQRSMRVPRRPEQLEKWFKEATKALGVHFPEGLVSEKCTRVSVDLERIDWVWYDGEIMLTVDRLTSGLAT